MEWAAKALARAIEHAGRVQIRILSWSISTDEDKNALANDIREIRRELDWILDELER